MQNIATLDYFIPYPSDRQKFRDHHLHSWLVRLRGDRNSCMPGGNAEQHKPSGRNLAIYRKTTRAIPRLVFYPKCAPAAIFIENRTHVHKQIHCRIIWNFAKYQRSHVHNDRGSDHELPIAKFRLKLKKVGKTTRPFRYDLNHIPYDYTVEVRNRFKGLDLIDRVPDELWNEVRDTVQETGIKTIPMEKKC